MVSFTKDGVMRLCTRLLWVYLKMQPMSIGKLRDFFCVGRVSILISHSHLGSVTLDTAIPPTSTAPTPPSAPAARLESSTTANPSWPRKIAGQTTSSLSELTKAYHQDMSSPPFRVTNPSHLTTLAVVPHLSRIRIHIKAPKSVAKIYPGSKWLLLDSSLDLRVTIDWLLHFASHTQRGITV